MLGNAKFTVFLSHNSQREAAENNVEEQATERQHLTSRELTNRTETRARRSQRARRGSRRVKGRPFPRTYHLLVSYDNMLIPQLPPPCIFYAFSDVSAISVIWEGRREGDKEVEGDGKGRRNRRGRRDGEGGSTYLTSLAGSAPCSTADLRWISSCLSAEEEDQACDRPRQVKESDPLA